jgi:very-short-patch-repair endonuclease
VCFKGYQHSEEAKKKMSLAHKGIPRPVITKRKISNALIGRSTWNKGLKCPQMSLALKGRKFSQEHLRNISESHKGRIHSKETRLKMSMAQKGNKNSSFGKSPSEETKKKMAFASTGKRQSKETIEKRSIAMRIIMGDDSHRKRAREATMLRWKDPKYAKRIIEKIHAKPNTAENKLEELLKSLFPSEWKYVGSGEVWIGGKNPDFINVNGQKKIIEFFGHHWHRDEEEETRKNHFKQYGFDTLIIWGNDLKNLESLKEKLRSFQ